jgi:hypothetical protein
VKWLLSTLVAVVLGAAACGGGTSNLDVCNAQCDSTGRCAGLPSATTQMCHDNCGNQSPELTQTDIAENNACKNAVDIRSAKVACYQGDCTQIETCLNGVPLCVGAH